MMSIGYYNWSADEGFALVIHYSFTLKNIFAFNLFLN